MKKNLASKLNNRVELWKKRIVEGPLGDTKEDVLVRKVWADIIPTGGSQRSGDGDTEYSETNFKIRVRKSKDIVPGCWIRFKGLRYDIKYILPNFDRNNYMDIFAELTLE